MARVSAQPHASPPAAPRPCGGSSGCRTSASSRRASSREVQLMDVASLRDVLVISGPCGAGKTSVGFECLELLEAGGVAAAMIDAELTYFHPKPHDDPQGTRIAEQALAAVAPVYAAAGIERLLLPRVIERPRHLDIVRAAVPGARFQIAWLDVPPETIAERLAAREAGSALDWHLQRAEEIRTNALAHDLFHIINDTAHTARDVSLIV